MSHYGVIDHIHKKIWKDEMNQMNTHPKKYEIYGIKYLVWLYSFAFIFLIYHILYFVANIELMWLTIVTYANLAALLLYENIYEARLKKSGVIIPRFEDYMFSRFTLPILITWAGMALSILKWMNSFA